MLPDAHHHHPRLFSRRLQSPRHLSHTHLNRLVTPPANWLARRQPLPCNTTTDDYGHSLTYDAWNRLVEYTDGGSLTVTYSYDGLNRRITQTQPAEDPRDFYYSANWQIVEERLGSNTDAQYVWSPAGGYVDAMVFRDKDTNVGNIRSFAMQDANFNVTRVLTLIEATSTWIAERYVNDPYGKFVTYNDAWTLAAGQVAFQHHHQGLMYNDLTGLYWNRNRDYNPSQQRFIQQDPAGYIDGPSLYEPLSATLAANTNDSWCLNANGAGSQNR